MAIPAVTGITPSSGTPGTPITVNGSGFTGVTHVIFTSTVVDNINASFTFISDTEVQCTTPDMSDQMTLTIDIKVQTSAGTSSASSADQFTFHPPVAPTVTGITPSSGLAGAIVQVSGSGFTDATEVDFGGVAGTSLNIYDDGDLSIVVPDGTGTVDVTVINPDGTSAVSSADQFTYGAPPAPGNGMTVTDIVADIQAMSNITTTAAVVVPFINRMLYRLGKKCNNFTTISIAAAYNTWYDLPADCIDVASVQNSDGYDFFAFTREAGGANSTGRIRFRFNDTYAVRCYTLPARVTGDGDTPGCHPLLHPFITEFCLFCIQKSPNDVDAQAWLQLHQAEINEALSQLPKVGRRNTMRTVR
jgi:hypothetical protein